MAALNPFTNARRIVIKIGSALLVDPDTGRLNSAWLSSLCADIADLRRQSIDCVIVSSGAIALGRTRLGLSGMDLSLSQKQACAAAGQSVLTRAYEDALNEFEIITAQALLTLNDTEDRRRWLNARSTVETLLELAAVPIINENDTVATDEIRYGDNDRLAARAAQMISADTLILLSDIDGLYDQDPREHPGANHIPIVTDLSEDILRMAGEANQAARVGTGGMVTKLAAARIATGAGCAMCIMDGNAPAPITRLVNGETCTWFKPVQKPKDARRQWIRGGLKAAGQLHIDAGAYSALKAGKSLLAAGVTKIIGEFSKGDAVCIVGPMGGEVARGLIAYSSGDAQKIAGQKSGEIASILGYTNGDALIHRDNLVMNKHD